MDKKKKSVLVSYLVSAPSLILIALMVVFPILYTFFISLTNMSVYHWFDFTIIGLQTTIAPSSSLIPASSRRCWQRYCGRR